MASTLLVGFEISCKMHEKLLWSACSYSGSRMKIMQTRRLLLLIVGFLVSFGALAANCEEPKVTRELVEKSHLIYSVEFVKFKKRKRQPRKGDCEVALCRPLDTFKGIEFPGQFVPIEYSLRDGDRHQDKKMVTPAKGTKWLIFIPKPALAESGAYQTYMGARGRVEFNDDTFSRLVELLNESKPEGK